MLRYAFKDITHCAMCGDPIAGHKVMGQRLNRSQGFNPRKKTGISVSIMQCRNCRLIYANPQPIPHDFQDHYGAPPESYWKEEYFQWTPDYFKWQIDTAKELIGFEPGMKALDIGAGLGKAMLSMQSAGFEVNGIEPSASFHEAATSRMNISADKLKQTTVEAAEYDANSFAFVSFGAVFEHLYEPAQCLEKAIRWTQPGGVVQIEVPSARWLMSKVMNTYFRLRGTNYVTNLSPMHPPYHLYEFDLASFEKLSERLPYRIALHHYDVASIYGVPKLLHPALRAWMRATNRGMQLTVFLQKTE